MTEQEELRIAGLETVETLNHLVKVFWNQQKAIILQKKIIEKEGGIQNYYALGLILHSFGLYNDEQVVLREMLIIDPNNDVAYYGLYQVLMIMTGRPSLWSRWT